MNRRAQRRDRPPEGRHEASQDRSRTRPPITSDAVLAAVVRLTRVIGAGRDMDRIFDVVTEEIERCLDVDRCSFGYYDPSAHTLRVAHIRGQLPHYPGDGDVRPLAGTVAGVVVERRQPVIHTVGAETEYSEDVDRRAAGVVEAVLLPVIVDDAIVGVLALSSRHRGAYHPEDLVFLETVADHFGVAVAATNLRRLAERRAARAQFLAETSGILSNAPDPVAALDQILEAAVSILGDVNAILLTDPDAAEPRLTALRSRSNDDLALLREVLTTREPPGILAVIAPAAGRTDVLVTRIDDETLPVRFRRDAARIGVRGLLAVPMVEHGHVVGLFVSARTNAAPPSLATQSLDAQDVALAREIATRVAGALISARLHTETRQALNESEALRRIGQELSSSVDTPQVFELISSFARLLLTGDFAAVAAEEPDGTFQWRGMVGNVTDAYREARYLFGYGPAGRAAATHRPVVIQDFPDSPRFPPDEFPVLQAEETRSALAVPLRVGERVFGALIVGYRRPRTFSAGELRLAEALAAQAAIALENARLFGEAQRAIAHRDQFLSVAAHELRTPMTTLRGRVQLLHRRMHHVLSPATEEAMQVIMRQVDRLGRMVNDLLDVSRVQTGRLPLARERIDLVELVGRSARDAMESGDGRIVEFASEIPALTAWVDPWRIEQVMANLLDNARRFTPSGGRIRVRLARDGDLARIEVEDEGVGIAAEHLERIFEPFYQIDPSPRRGVGLGLAICRQIVNDHGGRLWATSAASDRGSTFVMTLPLGDTE